MERRPLEEIKRYIINKENSLTLDEAKIQVQANFMDLNLNEFDDYKTISLIDRHHKRIQFPCRGINCKHLGCFDLNYWVNRYFETSDSKCTICDTPLSIQEIIWDPYIASIIEKTPISCTEINIKPDANWEIPFESIPATASHFLEFNTKEEEMTRLYEINQHEMKIEKKRNKVNQMLENAKQGNCCALYELLEKLIIGGILDFHRENGREGYICLLCSNREIQSNPNAVIEHLFSTGHLQHLENFGLSSPTAIPKRETQKVIDLEDIPPIPRQPFLHSQSNTSSVKPLMDNFIAL